MNSHPQIIVLDDDPTGSQTVHSCLLLMRWDVETLRLGLQDNVPIFFILTNTRALTPEKAEAVTREVCHNLKLALAAEAIEDFLVSAVPIPLCADIIPLKLMLLLKSWGDLTPIFSFLPFLKAGASPKTVFII